MDNTQVELAALIAKAWLDETFKELLESNPEAAFNEYNLKYEDYAPFILPARPQEPGFSAPLVSLNETSATCTYRVLISYDENKIIVENDTDRSSHNMNTDYQRKVDVIVNDNITYISRRRISDTP